MQQNLLGPAPYPTGFDLVLCRNVLIYFDETDRQAVVDRLVRAVAPGGYLGLGATELMKGMGVGGGWYAADSRGAAASCPKCKVGPACRSHAP
jgi:chemotaxis methyl-accepting protein methylase